MAAPANLVEVDDGRSGQYTVVLCPFPLRSECEFEQYIMKSQTYLHVDIVSNRVGGVVVQECE